jgi:hypothetical protein
MPLYLTGERVSECASAQVSECARQTAGADRLGGQALQTDWRAGKAGIMRDPSAWTGVDR